MTRCRFSSAFFSDPLATVGSVGDGKRSLYATTSPTAEFTYCEPNENVVRRSFRNVCSRLLTQSTLSVVFAHRWFWMTPSGALGKP